MISIQSHSKQIKLLNQYIATLQRQVAAANKEAEELTKYAKQGGEKQNQDLLKSRAETQQLKKQIGLMNTELARFQGLEKEYFGLRQFLQKLTAEKNTLFLSLQEATDNNKTLYDRMKELEGEVATAQTQQEAQRKQWQQEAETLKGQLLQSQKKNEELVNLLGQEKKNSGQRVSSLESNTNNILRIKNEQIAKLTKQLDESKQQLSQSLSEASSTKTTLNESIRQLNIKLTTQTSEIETLKRENGGLKNQLEKQSGDLVTITNTLNIKSKDYQSYMKRTNEEKTNLIRIVRNLQEEKRGLEAANASFKDDASEISKSLSLNLKKVQELTQRLDTADGELLMIRTAKAEADILITNLKKELEASYKANQKLALEKQQTLKRQSQAVRQKFNLETYFNQEIFKKDGQIESLRAQLEELTANLKTKSKALSSVQEELQEVKNEYASFRNQSLNLNDSHSTELDLLRNKLREAERRNSLTQERAEALGQQIKNLQANSQADRNTLEANRKELERLIQVHNKELADTVADFEGRLKKKGDELTQTVLEKQDILKKLKQAEDSFTILKEQSTKNEKSLRQTIRKVELERDSQIEKLNTVSLSSLIESQSRTIREGQVQSLRKSLAMLEVTLKEQRASIGLLQQGLAEKERQIEGLENSNATLRKQLISSISNQEASKRELIDVKSKAGSVLGNSRVRSTYLNPLRGSGVEEAPRVPNSARINTMLNIARSGSGDKRSFSKKRTTPQQTRFSMLDEPTGEQGETESLVE